MARREGFEISNRDWKEYIQEKKRKASANVQLNDAELEQVAAGQVDFGYVGSTSGMTPEEYAADMAAYYPS